MSLNWNGSDGSGNQYYYTTGIIDANDYNSIVDWYAKNLPNFSFSHVNSGDIIRAQQINDLLNYIRSYQPSFYYTTLSGNVSVGSIVHSLYFGLPIKSQRSMTWSSNGTFTVPGGCYNILVNYLLGGGGGGGSGVNYENGGSGGSGGSGGIIQNETINVNPGDIMYVNIGGGGLGSHYYRDSNNQIDMSNGLNGGSSNLIINGSVKLEATGGGGGGAAGPHNGGSAGSAGSPNGNPGTAGTEGGSHHSNTSSVNGPQGASTILGTGGQGGIAGGNSAQSNYGGNATGYGAGGGGAAESDQSGYYTTWGGGNGSGGFCQITYPA